MTRAGFGLLTSPLGDDSALLPAVASSTVKGLSHDPYGAVFSTTIVDVLVFVTLVGGLSAARRKRKRKSSAAVWRG